MGNFKKKVLEIFSRIKAERFSESFPKKIPIYDDRGKLIAFLDPLTRNSLKDLRRIKLLTQWRNKNVLAFPSQFRAIDKGTKKWIKSQVLNNPTRILFFIEDLRGDQVGHIGLYSFDFTKSTCEIDNAVRGKKAIKGIMTMALRTLIQWTEKELKPKKIYLRVFSDNTHAINFYKKTGFKLRETIPMEVHKSEAMIQWSENRKLKKAEKYFLKMEY